MHRIWSITCTRMQNKADAWRCILSGARNPKTFTSSVLVSVFIFVTVHMLICTLNLNLCLLNLDLLQKNSDMVHFLPNYLNCVDFLTTVTTTTTIVTTSPYHRLWLFAMTMTIFSSSLPPPLPTISTPTIDATTTTISFAILDPYHHRTPMPLLPHPILHGWHHYHNDHYHHIHHNLSILIVIHN